MAMRSCNKCLENNWSFLFNEGWITATCNMCAAEVMFETRNEKKNPGSSKSLVTKPLDPCYDCGQKTNSRRILHTHITDDGENGGWKEWAYCRACKEIKA